MTNKLIEGFVTHFRPASYQGDKPLMPFLVEKGQKPEYFIISCADSRSDPGTIFHTRPGDIFGFKSIGAIVRPYVTGTALAASLEFAINALGVKKLIILGHTSCGAIKALYDETDNPEIASFIDVKQSAVKRAQAIVKDKGLDDDESTLLNVIEQQVLRASAENLAGYPSVAKALQENRLVIEQWMFEMTSGNLLKYDPDIGNYVPLTPYGHLDGYPCACDHHQNQNQNHDHHHNHNATRKEN